MSTARMYDHMVNAVKGWPAPYALDKHAPLAHGEVIHRGMCMCLNANAQFRAGLNCAAVGVIATRESADADVRVSPGNITGGVMAGIVTLGPYEVETTEFDDTQDYNPNDGLTAYNDGPNRGIITRGTPYTDTLCGVVSDGVFTGIYRKTMLRFWTYYLPPLTCPSSPAIRE